MNSNETKIEYTGPAVAMAHALIAARDVVPLQILGDSLTRFLGLGSFVELVDAIAHGYRPTIRRDLPFDTNGDAYRALADVYDAVQAFKGRTYEDGPLKGRPVQCFPEGCSCHLQRAEEPEACHVCQVRAGRYGKAA